MTGESCSPSEGRDGPASKKAKMTSCAECRRLKIKCDRQVPCSACVARNRQHLCPDKVMSGIREIERERDRLAERNRDLEELLRKTTIPAFAEPPPAMETFDTSVFVSNIRGSADDMWLTTYDPTIREPTTSTDEPQFGTSFQTVAPSVSTSTPQKDSGTLVTASGERYIHIGPSAGMQWLRPDLRRGRISRPASPTRFTERSTGSSFGQSPGVRRFVDLFALLPRRQTIKTLVDNFFRRSAWIGSPIDPEEVEGYIESVFAHAAGAAVPFEIFHELSVIFAICSFGTSLDMEAPALQTKAADYLEWAHEALFAGRWLVYTTIPSLRALCLICKALPYADIEYRWDYTWQLSGWCMRMLLAMGLHRDGELWRLPSSSVDIRRRVFWDWMCSNAFMSANWDRAPGISNDQYDTQLPSAWCQPDRSFFAVHADIARLTIEALNETNKLGQASTRTMDIFGDILALDTDLPFHLRCRPALVAAGSREAIALSPEPEPEDLALTMQQHFLVLAIFRAMHTCLHAYFVSALKEFPMEPTRSAYGAPFMTMVERSCIVIATLDSLYSLYPLMSLRHWQLWTHGFSAAMILCVVLLVAPGSALAPLAKQSLDKIMELLPRLKNHLPREQIRKDSEWLSTLYARAREKTHSAVGAQGGEELRSLGLSTSLIHTREANPVVADKQGEAVYDQAIVGMEDSWWKGSIPPPLQSTEIGVGQEGLDEWLQSLFEA